MPAFLRGEVCRIPVPRSAQHRPTLGGSIRRELTGSMEKTKNIQIKLFTLPVMYSRGKALDGACEEERVPGDIIVTGKGQLSQYNKLQEKRSHRKTENTKPSLAIFSRYDTVTANQ